MCSTCKSLTDAITVIIEFLRTSSMCSVLISKITSKIIRRIFNSPFDQVHRQKSEIPLTHHIAGLQAHGSYTIIGSHGN